MPPRSKHTRMNDEEENYPDPERVPKRRNRLYQPITCLPMVWISLIVQIREKINYSLEHADYFLKNTEIHKRAKIYYIYIYIYISTSSKKPQHGGIM